MKTIALGMAGYRGSINLSLPLTSSRMTLFLDFSLKETQSSFWRPRATSLVHFYQPEVGVLLSQYSLDFHSLT